MFILGVVPSDSKFAAIEIAPGRLTPIVRLRGRNYNLSPPVDNRLKAFKGRL